MLISIQSQRDSKLFPVDNELANLFWTAKNEDRSDILVLYCHSSKKVCKLHLMLSHEHEWCISLLQ